MDVTLSPKSITMTQIMRALRRELSRATKERKRMENKKSNTNSRDIKRRIDVVMKKLDALRELGVPCAVCYVSHWTKGLMVYGDSRITNVISNQAATMLQELENSEEPEPHDPGLFLPPIRIIEV